MADSPVFTIRETNPYPMAACLRTIADLIESGRYVEVGGGILISGEHGDERIVINSDLILQIARIRQ